MSRNLLLGLCAQVVFFLSGTAQTHSVKLNTSFVLGLRQLGGFAIEMNRDSSSVSYGVGLEFGNFHSEYLSSGNSQIDIKTSVGAGLSPHFRFYPFQKKRQTPHGFFVESFTRIRWVRQSSYSNLAVTPNGYDLDDAVLETRDRWLIDAGLALGFKTGCGKRNMELEILTGYGLTPFQDSFTPPSYYRLELFISGIFSRKSVLPEDFFW